VNRLRGIGAARGYALGPAFHFGSGDVRVEKHPISDIGHEQQRWEHARSTAAGQIQAFVDKARLELAADQAAIFEAHVQMLQDPELADRVRRNIAEGKWNAEYSVHEAFEHFAGMLESMANGYLKARAADVRDIAHRVLRILLDIDVSGAGRPNQPSILLARDITPSDTIMLDRHMVLAFCTVAGSETSHSAILARGLGIPAVVSAGPEILSISNGTELIIDGLKGEILVEPTPDLRQEYRARSAALRSAEEQALTHSRAPAVTRDGQRVHVVANIGSLEGAHTALEKGAEGVGLLRTEFLYMERETLPTEDEQFRTYSSILKVLGDLPVILRTCDIGGDKALPYLEQKHEANPFLGVRGLRLALQHPDKLLRPQLRAALRAGSGHHLRIMFPMVAALEEILQARRILDECMSDLARAQLPFADQVQVGIMVEVPSAALLADRLAPEVDFLSIGTNDLTQYTLAIDRTNPQLAYLASAFSPAVLRLIHTVIHEAHKVGKWVGVCGELAGDPLAIPILLGLGLDEFSMSPEAIPRAKQILRELDSQDCAPISQKVLEFASAAEVKSYVRSQLPELADV
jgi:phosphoenolpyruvate-protein phosphotransferase